MKKAIIETMIVSLFGLAIFISLIVFGLFFKELYWYYAVFVAILTVIASPIYIKYRSKVSPS